MAENNPTSRRRIVLLLLVVGLAVGLFVLFAARFHYLGKRFYEAGQAALAEGDVQGALANFDLAARQAAPFSPWPDRALAAIRQEAQQFEKAGDIRQATNAYQLLLAAESATQSVFKPFREEISSLRGKVLALQLSLKDTATTPTAQAVSEGSN
ncbi:MAG: hypothetical protein V2A74_09785 [bacterium]